MIAIDIRCRSCGTPEPCRDHPRDLPVVWFSPFMRFPGSDGFGLRACYRFESREAAIDFNEARARAYAG